MVGLHDAFRDRRPRNRLLDALRTEDLSLILPHLEPVEGERGAVLFDPGEPVRFVHFPCDRTLIAMQVAMADGDVVECAIVGREGAVGGVVSHGLLPAYGRAVVQAPGPLLRIEVQRLQEAKTRSLPLRNLLTRYADCLLAQIVQSVACNALHPIEARAARWLLMVQDRIGGDRLPITQQTLAETLGVQRTYLNRVLTGFQKRGLLTSRQGVIQIHVREALERTACGCYGAVRDHYDAVLAGVYPAATDAKSAPKVVQNGNTRESST